MIIAEYQGCVLYNVLKIEYTLTGKQIEAIDDILADPKRGLRLCREMEDD